MHNDGKGKGVRTTWSPDFYKSGVFRQLSDEPLGIFPSQTGVGDRLAVHVFGNLLRAFDEVAFDHKALYFVPECLGMLPALHHLFGDPGLLEEALVRVCMVGVDDDRREEEVAFLIRLGGWVDQAN